MNLFPQMSRLPASFFEVTERVDELRFGNRVHQDVKTADRVNMLAKTIDELSKLVPGALPPELATNVAKARAMKLVKTVELTLEPAQPEEADAYPFRDFSRESIEIRKAAGRAIAALPAATAAPVTPTAPAKSAAPKTGAGPKTVAAPPVAPSPAAAPTAPPVSGVYTPRERLFLLRASCGGDVRALCPGVPLGGGRVIACLQAHAPSLSPNCQGAMAALAR